MGKLMLNGNLIRLRRERKWGNEEASKSGQQEIGRTYRRPIRYTERIINLNGEKQKYYMGLHLCMHLDGEERNGWGGDMREF